MKRLGGAILAAAMLACAAPVAAQGSGPNLLIMGEDADEDTVPRNSRVFNRVLNALAEQINEMGFNLYDETAITLDGFAQGRVRRTDAELIDIARSVRQPPIDVVMMFAIYASAERLSYTTKIRARIEGRLLQVTNGQRIGNFEVTSPDSWRAPVDCSRECILETVGANAKTLAQDLGAILTDKLAFMVDGGGGGQASSGGTGLASAYTLIFNNFTEDEMLDIEEYLVVFSGYVNHRTTRATMRNFEYWYESSISQSRLNRNLRKMLAQLELQGRVAMDGNKVTVDKVTKRGERRAKPSKDGDW
jgi:hypothetical protein